MSRTLVKGAAWPAVILAAILSRPCFAAEQPRLDRHGDPLPPGAVARLGTTRLRTEERSVGLTFSPDERLIAAADQSDRVYVWDTATGKEQCRFFCGTCQPSMTFSPDGRRLLVADNYEPARLWDAVTGRLVTTFGWRHNIPGQKPAPCFTPDGKHLLFVSHQYSRKQYVVTFVGVDGIDLQPLLTFGDGEECAGLDVSPDGKQAAVLTRHHGAWLVDLPAGRSRRTLLPDDESRSRRDIKFSHDGKRLVVGGENRITILDLTGKELATLSVEGRRTFYEVAFTPDDKSLVSEAGLVDVWDPGRGKVLRSIDVPATYLTVSPGCRLIAGADGYRIRLWDVATGKELLADLGRHNQPVLSLAFTPGGKEILTAGLHNEDVGVWDPATGKELRHITTGGGEVSLSPDGRRLLTGPTYREGGEEFHIWELGADKKAATFRVATGRRGSGFVAALPSDGKPLVAWFIEGPGNSASSLMRPPPAGLVLGRFDESGKALSQHTVRGPCPSEVDSHLSSDGRLLALRGRQAGEGFRVYAVESGKDLCCIPEATPNDSSIQQAAFSPDNSLVACVGIEGWISLFEVGTGRPVWRTGLYGRDVSTVAFSPDGRLLATADGEPSEFLRFREGLASWFADGWLGRFTLGNVTSAPHSVRLWDVPTGRELGRFEGHRSQVGALAFAPDGRRLAAGMNDTTALIWDVTSLTKPPAPAKALTGAEAAKLWDAAASADVPKAYRALAALAAAPDQAVPLLREHLRPAPPPDALRVRRLLNDLDSDDFDEREAATKALKELPPQAEASLRRALDTTTSEEVRKRLQAHLDKWSPAPTPEELRVRRAILLLGWIGTDEARAVLKRLAEGDPDAAPTRAARAALDGLARRSPAPGTTP